MPVLERDGARLSYVDTGDRGPAILFLHAFPVHGGMWAPQVQSLGQTFRVLAPDARGMGASTPVPPALTIPLMADDAAALLDHAGLTQAVVVGLSMGARAAAVLAMRRPDLVRALVLADTRTGLRPAEELAKRARFAEDAMEKGSGWVAERFVPLLLGQNPSDELRARVRALIEGNSPEAIASCHRGILDQEDPSAVLGVVRVPTLVIVGEEDRISPPAEAERVARAVVGARLAVVPRAGHLSNLENPAAFDEALGTLLSLQV